MGRADKLQRGLLAGSHSLIAQMIALRVSRYTFETVTALAVRDATLAAALAPMLAPLPDQAVAAKRWMVFESARGRAALAGIFEQCLATPDPAVAQGEQVLASSVFAIDGWLCRHRIGLHPHRTEQQIDQSWLAMMRSLDAGWPALLAQSAERARTLDARPAWQGVRWRNTFAMSDTLRQRLSWQDDGRALEVKTWRDATSGAGFDVKTTRGGIPQSCRVACDLPSRHAAPLGRAR